MKKLMTMLAAAAMTFGLYADETLGFISGASFNDYMEAVTFDAASGSEQGFWTGFATDNKNAINLTASTGTASTRPDYFVTSDIGVGANLAIKTDLSAPISRKIKAEGTATLGTYFDALVKVTLFDDDPTIASDAKIAVWAKEEADASGNVTGTNLYVTAGGAAGAQTTFNCGTFTKAGDWFRLTIKSLDITGTGDAGFVVFVDGVAQTYTAATDPFADMTLTVPAQLWKKNDSLFRAGAEGSTLSAVAFAGTGWVDDIVFTTGEPVKDTNEFAKDQAAYTVAWDATYMDNVTIDGVTPESNPAIIVGTTPQSVVIAWTGKGGKASGSKTLTPTGDAFKIEAKDLDAAQAEFNGVPYIFTDAITEAGKAVGTLKLLGDVTGDIPNTIMAGTILDLAGNTLTGDVKMKGAVVLTNSVATVGTITGAYMAEAGSIKVTTVRFGYDDNLDEGDVCLIPSALLPTDTIFAQGKGADADYWVIIDKPYFQVNDGEKFATLTAAIAAANEGDTINLLENRTLTDTTVTINKNLTLDFGGNTLTVPAAVCNGKFIIDGVTTTVTNGTISLQSENGYGIAVKNSAVLNVYCKVEQTGNTGSGQPVFDIYVATVNVYEGAEITSHKDVFRCKAVVNDAVEITTVNVYGGSISSDGDRGIFYNFKTNHVLNATITGGRFTMGASTTMFSYSTNKDNVTVNCTLTDACTAKFNKADASLADYIDESEYELVEDETETGWYVIKAAAPAGITITIVKSTGVADVQTNGVSVVGELPLEAGTTSIDLTLIADNAITIPVFKCGNAVTTKTATYDITDGDELEFFADEFDKDDVTEEQAKQAIVDAIDEGDFHDAAVAKVDAVIGEGINQVTAKALADYISSNNVASDDLAKSDYVAASVKLDTDDLITEETEVKIVDLTTGEGGAMTFEVDINDAPAVEAIKDMVKASDDLADWSLEVTATYGDGKVTVTPKDATDKAFMKVVIPQDPPTDK